MSFRSYNRAYKVPLRLSLLVSAVFALILTCSASFATPLHVYLTWQGDTSTTMTVNFQLAKKARAPEVYYDTVARDGDPKLYAHSTSADTRQVPEMLDPRYIHAAELTGLQPDTTYYFIAGDRKRGYSTEMKFRTAPAGDEPVRFITGGDMESTPITRKLLALSAKESPLFAAVGGDIAYGNGFVGPNITYNARRRPAVELWDTWLDNWEELMVTPEGNLIPMVLAIGNHEVRGGFNQRPERAPIYRHYFAQENGSPTFKRSFGKNMLLVVLDTNHITSHESQVEWLDRALAESEQYKFTFALYHVPLYPTFRLYDGPGSVEGRQFWMPVFDKHGLTAAFENHDHVLKRTKLLKNNQIDPSGTLYLGDGCFGQYRRPLSEENHRWYHEKTQSIEHFWVVDVTPNGVTYRAVGPDGEILDTVETK